MTQHRILIFSDIHGRFPLMYRLIRELDRENETPCELVLITGDAGIWPDMTTLDSATKKFSKKYPEELEFQHFKPLFPSSERITEGIFQRKEKRLLEAMFKETAPNLKILFVGGNHEDFNYLNLCCDRAKGALVPVEASHRIFWLPNGYIFRYHGLTLAGISGISADEGGRNIRKYHPTALIDDDVAIELLEKTEAQNIDLFLSHDGLRNSVRSCQGSSLLIEVIGELKPTFHFFGHFHSEIGAIDYETLYGIKETRSFHLNKLGFGKDGRLRRHSVIELCFNEEEQENKSVRFIPVQDLQLQEENWLQIPRKKK